MAELWTTEQCAEHCGIAIKTWSSLHAKGIVPRYVERRANRPYWDSDTVIQWEKTRPHTPGRPRKQQ